jgi:hypothetical protein
MPSRSLPYRQRAMWISAFYVTDCRNVRREPFRLRPGMQSVWMCRVTVANYREGMLVSRP